MPRGDVVRVGAALNQDLVVTAVDLLDSYGGITDIDTINQDREKDSCPIWEELRPTVADLALLQGR